MALPAASSSVQREPVIHADLTQACSQHVVAVLHDHAAEGVHHCSLIALDIQLVVSAMNLFDLAHSRVRIGCGDREIRPARVSKYAIFGVFACAAVFVRRLLFVCTEPIPDALVVPARQVIIIGQLRKEIADVRILCGV